MPFGLSAAAVAGIASAAVTAGTAIAGAVGSSGSTSSGQSQANGAQTAAYNQYSSNEQPYLTAGTGAVNDLANADGLNGATGDTQAVNAFQASPGYQYQLGQAESAVDNGAASRGTLRSGNTIRAEESVASGLANSDYTNYLGRLNSLAGLGQTATSALGSAGVSTGQGEASTDTSAANQQAGIDNNLAKGLGTAGTQLAGSGALNGLFSSNASTQIPAASNSLSGVSGINIGFGS